MKTIIIGLRKEPNSLRTQYQVHNSAQIRRTWKVIENDNDELILKIYPKKKQPNIQQRKIFLPFCPSCKKVIWVEFDTGYYCRNCVFIIKEQKLQIDKKNF